MFYVLLIVTFNSEPNVYPNTAGYCTRNFIWMGGGGTPWPESASKVYRPSIRRLSAELVTTFAARGYYMVGVMDPHGRILGFLDRNFIWKLFIM
jgi:hypothetical protein